ncbi:metal ABC transporter solute-binding protein, Zn/Mn family [Prosthecomicrobium sp. N25]|uniref:metal ABC transporter solute-binding protein, Zn/Mn family n=1 Tax=Prosthecomicrobium sp. N25 TaxID=3129254 RepID=UPI003077CBC5
MSPRRATLGVALLAALLLPGTARAGETVLAGIRPIQGVAAALAAGTGLTVEPAAEPLPGMARLARTLARPDPARDRRLAAAAAVVTVDSVWPEDPLYREARARNIRVVRIDAARALDGPGLSVAVVARPSSSMPWRRDPPAAGPAPQVWFSLANCIRMAEIVAGDMRRLAPADAAAIEANRAAFVQRLQALKAEYEARFAALPDPRVLALTDRFVYLTNEFGLDVEGYLLEDDVRWTKADLDGLAAFLKERDLRVVLHHWEPAAPIRQAIAAGGARLVVLDDLEAAPPAASAAGDLERVLRSNLDRLAAALGN